jgi:hypothetical protein
VIFPTLLGVRIRRGEQRIDLSFFQIGKRILSRAFEGNALDFPAPHQVLRAAFPDKVCKGVYGRQPLVASCNAAAALFFDDREELPYSIGG